jgi:hypothetical protein
VKITYLRITTNMLNSKTLTILAEERIIKIDIIHTIRLKIATTNTNLNLARIGKPGTLHGGSLTYFLEEMRSHPALSYGKCGI